MISPAFNLQDWIDQHRHLLKPPVGNKCIVDGDFIIMIVGGPNARTDGNVRDIPIRAGEMFYLPPRVPHSPQRAANSIGLVIERLRLPHELDGLLWYCDLCNHKLYEEFFELKNVEQDFLAVFDRFYVSREARTCNACGHLNPAPARYG